MEAMSVESIIQAYWQIQNYFTIPRFSFKVKNGYSDIDMLAFKPKLNEKDTSILVLCESKAHGEKNKIKYSDFNDLTKASSFRSLVAKHPKSGPQHELIHFIDKNVIYILKNHLLNNLIDLSIVNVLKVQFISTAFFHNEANIKSIIEVEIESVLKEIFKESKKPINIKVVLEIKTHFDIIKELFPLVQGHESGKRYGNIVLDFIREMNRYIHVNACEKLTEINYINNALLHKEKGESSVKFKARKLEMLQKLFKDDLHETFNYEKSEKDISIKLNSKK